MNPRTPKVWQVILRLRSWPTEIEADLQREYQIDLNDWHRGALSSRRLMVLIDNLSETSRYKTEFERGGNWPVWMRMLKDIHTETALHRASLYAGGENAYSPMVYLDPVEQEQVRADAQDEDDFLEQSTEELADMMGWT